MTGKQRWRIEGRGVDVQIYIVNILPTPAYFALGAKIQGVILLYYHATSGGIFRTVGSGGDLGGGEDEVGA